MVNIFILRIKYLSTGFDKFALLAPIIIEFHLTIDN